VTFQRLLRRLAPADTWVLKGGYLLEARLGTSARATRDLDLGAVHRLDALELREAIERCLTLDVDNDGFVFRITGVREHLSGNLDAGGPGLHLSISADLDGRPFAQVRIDVVSRPDELDGGVEAVVLPPAVRVHGWPDVEVQAVDLAQHAAEKLHALSQVDAHPRPSTRVKDLADLVLLLDCGALDERRLAERVVVVFTARDGTPPAHSLPVPPEAWRTGYAEYVRLLGLPHRDLDVAFAEVSSLFDRVRIAAPTLQEDNS
jgi:predicted nucleotidyltransferase component of viral defense system